MCLIIIFLPLIGSFLAGFFGRYLGTSGAIYITCNCIGISLICSCINLWEVGFLNSPVYINLGSWISSGTIQVDWGFMFDSLSVLMCVIVCFVSLLVHIFSVEYMSSDPHVPRFMSYLSLFTFFMLMLVTADNFIQMFFGWEGVGLASYLLINFWFTRLQANKAAIKAMVVNRIGDFFLLIGIILISIKFYSVDYASVFCLVPYFKNDYILFFNIPVHLLSLIGIFLFLGAIGKSAQLGLHTWLPDAMEGPTPVSALIHAATMVTAGVFLLVRTSYIFEYTYILNIIVIFGALTTFFAATTGLAQNDIKKVIAYSTCSQLGYMMFACGLSHYSVGFFHLSNHAFFKALLFLSAGAVIHSINDEQDMRKMGGLKNLLPFSYSMFLIGSLALMGFPFLSGFYSKDLILEAAISKYTTTGYFSYFLGSFSAFFTSFYSTRLLYLTFLSKPNGYRKIICYAMESGLFICLALALLAFFSLFVGFFSKDFIVGLGSSFFDSAIFVNKNNFTTIDAEFLNTFFKLFPVLLSLFGSFSAFFIYFNYSNLLFICKTSLLGRKIYTFLNKKWFFDKIYNEIFNQFFFKFSFSLSYKFMDKGIFEILGPTGLSSIVYSLSLNIHRLQTGSIYHYNLILLFGLSLLFSLRTLLIFVYHNVNYGYYSTILDFRLFLLFIIASVIYTYYPYNQEKQDFVYVGKISK